MSKDKIYGCMIGAIVGDALGMPMEFKRYPFKVRGKPMQGLISNMLNGSDVKGSDPNEMSNKLKAGQFTDDTEMAFCIIEAYKSNQGGPLSQKAVAREFVSWFKRDPTDVGIFTRKVLSKMNNTGSNWEKISLEAYDENPNSAANGTTMRTWPVSIACSSMIGEYSNDDCRNQIIDDAVAQCVVTHRNAYAVCGAVYINLVHYYIFLGNSLKNSFQMALDDPFLKIPNDFRNHIQNAINSPMPFEKLVSLDANSGWNVNSVVNSIHASLKTKSFQDAVVYASNLGDDADTVASITGAIVGAFYGYDSIPQKYKDAIHGAWPIKSKNILRLEDFLDIADELSQ